MRIDNLALQWNTSNQRAPGRDDFRRVLAGHAQPTTSTPTRYEQRGGEATADEDAKRVQRSTVTEGPSGFDAFLRAQEPAPRSDELSTGPDPEAPFVGFDLMGDGSRRVYPFVRPPRVAGGGEGEGEAPRTQARNIPGYRREDGSRPALALDVVV